MQPYVPNIALSDLTRQLLPLFAPFRSHITLAADLIEEYLMLLLDFPSLRARPLAEFYTMADELVDGGWWSKPNLEWEIFAIHPLLAALAHRLFACMTEEERESVHKCFIHYYGEVLAPKAIYPYVMALKASAQNIGVFVAQYEAGNLENAVVTAAARGRLTEVLYSSLDGYWRTSHQHQERVRLSGYLLEQFQESIAATDILPVILFHRAAAQKQLGRYVEAEQTIREALLVVPETDNRRAVLRQQLGNVLKDLGRHPEAAPHFEAALAVFREVGDEMKIAEMYQNLGVISSEEKDYDDALSLTEQALRLYEKQGRQYFQAMAHQNLAAAWLEKGEHDKALEVYEEALRIMETYDGQAGIASICRSIGVVYSEQGKLAEAGQWFRRALEIYLASGSPDERGLAWFDYGSTALKSGDLNEALEYYNQAEKAYQSPRGKGRVLHMTAYIYSNYRKDPLTSIPFYQAAITYFEEMPKGDDWVEARFNLGNVLLELSRKEESIQCYEPVARWFETEDRPADKAIAYLYHNLTLACYQAGEMKKGRRYLERAKALYETLGDEESRAELLEEIEAITKTDIPRK